MSKSKKTYQSPLPTWLAGTVPVKIFTSLYAAAVKRRNLKFDNGTSKIESVNHPVISIGGIRAGGTGKTPTSMMVGEMLSEMGATVAFLSRGYKRESKQDFIAQPGELVSWKDCGDEPAMLHNSLLQSWLGISARRIRTAKKISTLAKGDLVFVLDDGFQHRMLKRNLDIVCINETVFDDRMIPDGYLREPVASLSRADLILIIGDKENITNLMEIESKIKKKYSSAETYILHLEPCGWVHVPTGRCVDKIECTDPVAVCGIARPERFFSTLKNLGLTPCKKIVYSDHHSFTKDDFSNIHELYSKGLVLTEKDAIRINKFSSEICDKIWYLKVRLKFHSDDSEKRFKKKLQYILPN